MADEPELSAVNVISRGRPFRETQKLGYYGPNYYVTLVNPTDRSQRSVHAFASKAARTRWLKKLDEGLVILNGNLGLLTKGKKPIRMEAVLQQRDAFKVLKAIPVKDVLSQLEQQHLAAA